MKNKNAVSLFITMLCAVMILAVGYMGIVKGGKILLNSREEPEKAEFVNTSSNVFYEKIDEDIQLFPWNYYDKSIPEENDPEGYFSDIDLWEATFREILSYNCGVLREDINEVYAQKGIMYRLTVYEADMELIFFYQDTLEVRGKKFQVKLAFNPWNILHFSCIEYREGDVRESPEWEEGKGVLTRMLARYSDIIGEQFINMRELYDEVPSIKWDRSYAMVYEDNRSTMNSMLPRTSGEKAEEVEEVESQSSTEEVVIKKWGNYSYQVIELNDMILLLIQGDITVGYLYDPIERTFCGYNYFE